MSTDSTKHIPGEWFAKGKHVRYRLPGFTTSELLADCDTESTAHLIVKMLSALKATEKAIVALEGQSIEYRLAMELSTSLKQIRAAISKAEEVKS